MSSTSRPPESLQFFLDESLDSPSVVTPLRDASARLVRATDVFPRGTPDSVWLTAAGKEGWVVLTRDKRIRYRMLERMALESARVRTFVFTGGNVTGRETGEILVRAVPKIERIARSEPGPFIYHLGKAGKPIRMD